MNKNAAFVEPSRAFEVIDQADVVVVGGGAGGVGAAAAQMIAKHLATTRDVNVAEVQKALRAAGALV